MFVCLIHCTQTQSTALSVAQRPRIDSLIGWRDTQGARGRMRGRQKELFLSLSWHNAQRPPRCLVIQRLLLDRAAGMIGGSRQSSCTKTAALLGCKQDPCSETEQLFVVCSRITAPIMTGAPAVGWSILANFIAQTSLSRTSGCFFA